MRGCDTPNQTVCIKYIVIWNNYLFAGRQTKKKKKK